MADCEECGSSKNVKQFRHFDTNTDEWLCWECRKPIVMDRIHDDSSEKGEECDDEQETSDSEKSGQTKLTEQW